MTMNEREWIADGADLRKRLAFFTSSGDLLATVQTSRTEVGHLDTDLLGLVLALDIARWHDAYTEAAQVEAHPPPTVTNPTTPMTEREWLTDNVDIHQRLDADCAVGELIAMVRVSTAPSGNCDVELLGRLVAAYVSSLHNVYLNEFNEEV